MQQKITNAAAGYMPRNRAEELCRNITMGLGYLDDTGASNLERWAYIVGAIDHRVREFGLRCMCPGDAARTILEAWGAGRAAA